jgi:hypothetical protein
VRPEGMSNAKWAFDLQRRKVENASRRQREEKAREPKDLAAEAMEAPPPQHAPLRGEAKEASHRRRRQAHRRQPGQCSKKA